MNGHYGQAPYGYAGQEDPEEMVELNAASPGYRNLSHNNSSSTFDFHFNDASSPSIASPRPVMPFRPGHLAQEDHGSPYSSPQPGWLQPTPRSSVGPDSFPYGSTPYDSRSASPTLVS